MNHSSSATSSATRSALSISDSISNSDREGRLNPLVPEITALFSNTEDRVREALSLDLSASTLSREEVARRLSHLTGRAISVPTIEAYVAASKPHRFPTGLIPAWVRITGSRRILDVLTEELGLSIATQADRDFAELGRIEIRREKLTRELWERV